MVELNGYPFNAYSPRQVLLIVADLAMLDSGEKSDVVRTADRYNDVRILEPVV